MAHTPKHTPPPRSRGRFFSTNPSQNKREPPSLVQSIKVEHTHKMSELSDDDVTASSSDEEMDVSVSGGSEEEDLGGSPSGSDSEGEDDEGHRRARLSGREDRKASLKGSAKGIGASRGGGGASTAEAAAAVDGAAAAAAAAAAGGGGRSAEAALLAGEMTRDAALMQIQVRAGG